MGAPSAVIELQPQPRSLGNNSCHSSNQASIVEHCHLPVDADIPPTAVAALEKWNSPRSNIYRTFATFWSFFVMGANDAAYGVSRLDLILHQE